MIHCKTLFAVTIISLPVYGGDPPKSAFGLWGRGQSSVVLEAWTPDLSVFQKQLEGLVRRYYPNCVVEYENNALSFQYRTRKFWIHKPYLDGGWQDARQELGPNPKGIYCEITPRKGNLRFQAVVPQKVDRHYYVDYWMQAYSPKLDASLITSLRYPRDVDPKFISEFEALLNRFDKFVSDPAEPE